MKYDLFLYPNAIKYPCDLWLHKCEELTYEKCYLTCNSEYGNRFHSNSEESIFKNIENHQL